MAKRKKKVDYSPMLDQEMRYRSIEDITVDGYCLFGEYCNNQRALPDLRDGLKISYRRLLQSALSFPAGKFTPTAEVITKVSLTSPHSTDGLKTTVSNWTRKPTKYDAAGNKYKGVSIFDGHGNFGSVGIIDKDETNNDGAATRYTKVRISDAYRKVLGDLIHEVPWHPSPQVDDEAEYIPFPLPLCFFLGADSVSGLGVAIKSDIPNFSARSMYEAYINNDPSLLCPDVDLILDYQRSELGKLWTTGKGKITYSFRLQEYTGEDGKTQGVLIYGDPGIITVSQRKLDKYMKDGKIVVEDVSTVEGKKLLISRMPNARGFSYADLKRLCENICYSTLQFNLAVTDGKSAFVVPLYNWIDFTYKNYIGLINQVNLKRIAKTEFDISVQKAIPIIVDYITNTNPKATDKEISKNLGISLEVIEAVMSKPISHLRKNKDTTDRIKLLKKKLADLKAFDPVIFTRDVINEL